MLQTPFYLFFVILLGSVENLIIFVFSKLEHFYNNYIYYRTLLVFDMIKVTSIEKGNCLKNFKSL